eukprot:GHVS01042370.1.p1 GENE.GHVS01042370.1~~GHVS01042370.1.p1  ORF type:complete len:568 (+),score=138.64 GHVS01042370.1:326-2029(+)
MPRAAVRRPQPPRPRSSLVAEAAGTTTTKQQTDNNKLKHIKVKVPVLSSCSIPNDVASAVDVSLPSPNALTLSPPDDTNTSAADNSITTAPDETADNSTNNTSTVDTTNSHIKVKWTWKNNKTLKKENQQHTVADDESMSGGGLSAPEKVLLDGGGCKYKFVVGVDEAGRGPLAGPVVVAACVIPTRVQIRGIQDSKKLTEEQREAVFERIINCDEIVWCACKVDREAIDSLNILQATLTGMAVASFECIAHVLADKPEDWYHNDNDSNCNHNNNNNDSSSNSNNKAHSNSACQKSSSKIKVLVDGPYVPQQLLGKDIVTEACIKGDGRFRSIAAASIIAKVLRDRLMMELHSLYPQYGFSQHKGYPTAHHRKALACHGPCVEHRRSFQPVKGMIELKERNKETANNKECRQEEGKKQQTLKKQKNGATRIQRFEQQSLPLLAEEKTEVAELKEEAGCLNARDLRAARRVALKEAEKLEEEEEKAKPTENNENTKPKLSQPSNKIAQNGKNQKIKSEEPPSPKIRDESNDLDNKNQTNNTKRGRQGDQRVKDEEGGAGVGVKGRKKT